MDFIYFHVNVNLLPAHADGARLIPVPARTRHFASRRGGPSVHVRDYPLPPGRLRQIWRRPSPCRRAGMEKRRAHLTYCNPARHALALAIKATLDPKTLFNPGKVPYRAD
ncbi:MAG: hypothetical protein J0H80_05825 [Rhizobiales bacterium]|nr:hypothetical protein [Hyphomicrobiales bacterium]